MSPSVDMYSYKYVFMNACDFYVWKYVCNWVLKMQAIDSN